MTEINYWLETYITAGITMPPENLAIVAMSLVSLAVIWKSH
jgi:hypothetical protein